MPNSKKISKKTVKILSLKNKLWIADQCIVADSFWGRLRGLIGKKTWEKGQGLILDPCNDIHMWMMSISIDVIFVTKEGGAFRVTSIHSNLKPWKVLPVRDGRASMTLELPVGTIQRCEVCPGDELCIS